MATLFISDLHLTGERPDITRLFLGFLANDARRADALYILGDLFEYWIGDDVLAGEVAAQEDYRAIVAALKALTASGVPVFVMHGNRDFLLGEDFARATGCRLLPDPTVIELHGRKTLLMHGDLLCSDDIEYQQVRLRVRDPRFIQGFLARPVPEREALVRDYRAQSKAVTSQKKPEIMDVNADTVLATMQAHRVQRLIHGHTHRPAVHALTADGQARERIVLGDWYEQGSVLRCDEQGCVLEGLRLS